MNVIFLSANAYLDRNFPEFDEDFVGNIPKLLIAWIGVLSLNTQIFPNLGFEPSQIYNLGMR